MENYLFRHGIKKAHIKYVNGVF